MALLNWFQSSFSFSPFLLVTIRTICSWWIKQLVVFSLAAKLFLFLCRIGRDAEMGGFILQCLEQRFRMKRRWSRWLDRRWLADCQGCHSNCFVLANCQGLVHTLYCLGRLLWLNQVCNIICVQSDSCRLIPHNIVQLSVYTMLMFVSSVKSRKRNKNSIRK